MACSVGDVSRRFWTRVCGGGRNEVGSGGLGGFFVDSQDVKSKKSWNSSGAGIEGIWLESAMPKGAIDEDPEISEGSCPTPARSMSSVSEISDVRDSWPSLPAARRISSVICSMNALASSSVLIFSTCCSFLTSTSLGGPSHSVLTFFGDGALAGGALGAASSSSRCLLRLLAGEGAVAGAGSGVGGTFAEVFRLGAVGLGLGLPFGDFGVFGEAAAAAGVAGVAAGVDAGGV